MPKQPSGKALRKYARPSPPASPFDAAQSSLPHSPTQQPGQGCTQALTRFASLLAAPFADVSGCKKLSSRAEPPSQRPSSHQHPRGPASGMHTSGGSCVHPAGQWQQQQQQQNQKQQQQQQKLLPGTNEAAATVADSRDVIRWQFDQDAAKSKGCLQGQGQQQEQQQEQQQQQAMAAAREVPARRAQQRLDSRSRVKFFSAASKHFPGETQDQKLQTDLPALKHSSHTSSKQPASQALPRQEVQQAASSSTTTSGTTATTAARQLAFTAAQSAKAPHLPEPIIHQLGMLAKARRKMEHYLRMAPGLALPASFLMGPLDTTFAGFGTFAAVWITSAQLPFHDAAQLSPSQSSRPSRQPRYAIKVLQVPIGNQKARFYPQGFNAHAAANGYGYTLYSRNVTNKQFEHLRWLTFFVKEIEALIACRSHPGIVKLVGFCIDDPVLLPSLVMEYAGPGNLWQTLFSESRHLRKELGWEQACGILFQLLDAIDFMHWRLPAPGGPGTAGFCIHRDISPGNIMLSYPDGPDGIPHTRLIDLGLAELKTLRDLPSQGPFEWVQEDGVPVGPEMRFLDPVMWKELKYARGTDIFGYGSILLLLLFGRNSILKLVEGISRDEQLWRICDHRNFLRNQLYRLPIEKLLEGDLLYPLHRRWKQAPPKLLRVLKLQAADCTMQSRENVLALRPSSCRLLEELSKCQDVLPQSLIDLLVRK